MSVPPRGIQVITTGGTIASRKTDGVSPEELALHLAQLVPEHGCQVAPFCQLGSSHLTLELLWQLAGRVEAARSQGHSVVITHGTDTLEETAFFLDAVLGPGLPVVLTGAMRPADAPGGDGWANLRHACQAAGHPQLTGAGVTVTLGGELHAARHLVKIHSRQVHAFTSFPAGPLALIEEKRWQWLGQPWPAEPRGYTQSTGPVELIKLVLDATPRLVELAGTYARGLVVETLGNGGGPPAVMAALRQLVEEGLPVVLTSRCLGGGATGEPQEFIYTTLPGPKARLLLMLALAATQKPSQLPEHFRPYA